MLAEYCTASIIWMQGVVIKSAKRAETANAEQSEELTP